MPSASNENFTPFLSVWMIFLSFYCLIAMVWASNTLNRSGKSEEAGPCGPQCKMYIAYCLSTGELSHCLSYMVNKEITLGLCEGWTLGLRVEPE